MWMNLGRALYPRYCCIRTSCVLITLSHFGSRLGLWRLCSLSARQQEAFIGESKKQKFMRPIALSIFQHEWRMRDYTLNF